MQKDLWIQAALHAAMLPLKPTTYKPAWLARVTYLGLCSAVAVLTGDKLIWVYFNGVDKN